MSDQLLEVRHLRVDYPGRRRRDGPVHAIDDVDLTVGRGETLGLVGESGSGKSTIGKVILGLVRPTSGQVLFYGNDITRLSGRGRRDLASHIQVIFQDPFSSLNPSKSIGSMLAEPLWSNLRISRRMAMARVADILEQVGMPPDTMSRYPGEFSGGQRQRIAIARALVLEPQLIVCDEPTSALDLSIQAQILNLLLDLQERLGLGYLFISHDIDAVRHMSHRVAVLFEGHIAEQGPARQVTDKPRHEYTKKLISAAAAPEKLSGRPARTAAMRDSA